MELWSLNVTLYEFRDENMLVSMIDRTAGRALALAVHDKHRVCGGTLTMHAIATYMQYARSMRT